MLAVLDVNIISFRTHPKILGELRFPVDGLDNHIYIYIYIYVYKPLQAIDFLTVTDLVSLYHIVYDVPGWRNYSVRF